MKLTTPDCQTCAARGDSLFCLCTPSETENINEHKIGNFYKKGQIIFHENAHPVCLYCMSSGTVKLSKTSVGGREQILRIAHSGNFLGYRALLTNTPYHFTATALEDTYLCVVPKSEFINLLHNNAKFYEALMALVCKDAEEAENKVAELSFKPVRGRVAEALLLLATAYKSNEISLPREDLASFVGTVKETLIRSIGELRDEKIITIDKRKIKIIDANKLAHISNLYD